MRLAVMLIHEPLLKFTSQFYLNAGDKVPATLNTEVTALFNLQLQNTSKALVADVYELTSVHIIVG